MTYLPTAEVLHVGVMCASPEGDGYVVTFEDRQIKLAG
jgi:regulation of enolase protein 1 (concanavalin A-like superfamily)